MSLTLLVVFESRSLEKTYIDFSNNKFSRDTGIINLFRYIWKILFIHKNA